MPSHYFKRGATRKVGRLQQLPERNYAPGVYGGFSHANPVELQGIRNQLGDQFAAERRNTADRRQEAADIIAGNRENAAAASAEFNRPTNRPNVGRGRVPGTKFYTGKGRRHAQTISQFHDAARGISMVAGAQRDAWRKLAADPRTSRLSNNQQRGYVAAFAGPSLGHENIRQKLQRAGDQDRYARLLGERRSVLGVRRSRRGLGRRRSRV